MCSIEILDNHMWVTYTEYNESISYVIPYLGSIEKHIEQETILSSSLCCQRDDEEKENQFIQSQRVLTVLRAFTV